jgi:hypothetical protein
VERALSLSPFVIDIAYRTIIGVPQGHTQYVRMDIAKTSSELIRLLDLGFEGSILYLLLQFTSSPYYRSANDRRKSVVCASSFSTDCNFTDKFWMVSMRIACRILTYADIAS